MVDRCPIPKIQASVGYLRGLTIWQLPSRLKPCLERMPEQPQCELCWRSVPVSPRFALMKGGLFLGSSNSVERLLKDFDLIVGAAFDRAPAQEQIRFLQSEEGRAWAVRTGRG